MKRSIVLNIPHTSINGIFDAEIGKWPRCSEFVAKHVNRLTDWYVDFLFGGMADKGNVSSVIFPYSRFVCDTERLKDDPLEAEGNGIIYAHAGDFSRGSLDEQQRGRLLGLWDGHQTDLLSRLSEGAVLVDCHSFPSDMGGPDICIGHNEDWSYDAQLVEGVRKVFESMGYTVGVNTPYSNSITPAAPFRYTSLMIEVNKRVYMNEATLQLEQSHGKWQRWNDTVGQVYELLSRS